MQALINAGGKGTRMGACGIEKPMQIIGGRPIVGRVVDALMGSENTDRILVSVSDNTPETEKYLKSIGIETIKTSGEDFVKDLHDSFKVLGGRFVLTCPSDLPFISTREIDGFISAFDADTMESFIAIVDRSAFSKLGIKPSYTIDRFGSEWALSGVSIMDREKTLQGIYLRESFYETDSKEFAVNVNTKEELNRARKTVNGIRAHTQT
ncbi:MAG: NTP transferase domain-containing protein [Candidatus Methanoplasma sp.]|jgi:adenosylcobinamide-phosphate guanylyltransferase|nr:NTP transferase domain-containing protein [Candidatus Methanoplasma sp.]